jgi:hypothetical protein
LTIVGTIAQKLAPELSVEIQVLIIMISTVTVVTALLQFCSDLHENVPIIREKSRELRTKSMEMVGTIIHSSRNRQSSGPEGAQSAPRGLNILGSRRASEQGLLEKDLAAIPEGRGAVV